MRNHAQFKTPNETLYRVYRFCCVDDTNHAYACETHVGKNLKVAGLSDFVIYSVVRPDQKQHIGRILERTFELCVLRYLRLHLQVAWRLHRLYYLAFCLEKLCNRRSKCRFSRTWRACYYYAVRSL